MGRSLGHSGPSFFAGRGMNPFDRCHRSEEAARTASGRGEGDAGMDSDQLGRLIDQHAAALELYARQWSDAAEDVVQVAFLKLAQQGRSPR